MNLKRRLACLALGLLAWASVVSAQTLGVYTFPTSLTDVPTHEGLVFSPVSSTSGLSVTQTTGTYGLTNDPAISAKSLTVYSSFSFHSTTGYTWDLTGVSFDVIASIRPLNFLQAAILVNGDTVATSDTFTIRAVGTVNCGFDFTDITGLEADDTVELRLYSWNSGSARALTIDNVTINGTVEAVTPVPEPAAVAAIFGAAGLAVVCWYRRSRRA